MIYKNHRIDANVPEWTQYTVNDDGTIGDWKGDNGGADFSSTEYDIYARPDTEYEELVDGGYDTIEEAKRVINERIRTLERLHDRYSKSKSE